MNAYHQFFGTRLRLGAMALASAIVASPAVSLARTSAWANAQTFLGSGSAVTDAKVATGAHGQAVDATAGSTTTETAQNSHATAYAYAAEGILRASVSANASTTGGVYDGGRGQSYATARWDDSLTINAVTTTNDGSGYAMATIDVSGNYGGSLGSTNQWDTAEHLEAVKILGTGITQSTTGAYACGGWSLCDYQDIASWGINNHFSSIPSVISVKIPVTFGSLINLTYVLDLTDLAFAHSGTAGTGTWAQAAVDYGHTLRWGGISGVYDSTGALVSSYTATSASGFNYLSAAPVPEPQTYALLLAGLGLMTAIVRRRKQG